MTAEPFYLFAASIIAVIAVRIALNPEQERRFGTATFWLLLALSDSRSIWLALYRPLADSCILVMPLSASCRAPIPLPFNLYVI